MTLIGPVAPLLTNLSLDILFLLTTLLSLWKSKKQYTVSRSSAEAEYRYMTVTYFKLKWLLDLLCDLHVPITRPIPLFCDN